jgi:hypothetical protein
MNSKDSTPVRSNMLIVALAECVVFCAVWLWNEYVATYATIILPGVMAVILLLSLIAEFIEPSRIPKWYYYIMVISILIPLVVGMFFMYIYGGNLGVLKK